MRVRALDANHDWQFGRGVNDFLVNINAVAQAINTRLSSFLGDCFFDQGAGIDWFTFLGSKNEVALNLAISSVILNTENVVGLVQLSIALDVTRALTVRYTVQTVYSQTSNIFSLDLNGIG